MSAVRHDRGSLAAAVAVASSRHAEIRGFENKSLYESVYGQGHKGRDVNRHSYLLPSHSFLGASTRYGDHSIKQTDTAADPRLDALVDWINSIDAVSGCEPRPASADASFRRYFRLQKGPESFIAMDAPPSQEDCRPFVGIAADLISMGLNAPEVLEADLDKGFLLMTDLGTELYLDRLTERPAMADSLYFDATEALHRMQTSGAALQAALPPYDEKLLRAELSLFRDWLCGSRMQFVFSNADEAQWQACCDALVANALSQPRVFVHRDYHSRNLMVTKDNNPGVLDFQDAVEGPFTYDLVSLLKDCYVQWPAEQVRQWALNFHAGLDAAVRQTIDEPLFIRQFELMGVHRHLKAAGIFCRLWHRDGKAGYLGDVPRTLEYILELGPKYAELGFLVRLIDEQVLPDWDVSP